MLAKFKARTYNCFFDCILALLLPIRRAIEEPSLKSKSFLSTRPDAIHSQVICFAGFVQRNNNILKLLPHGGF